MENGESHASWEDVVLSPLLQSLEMKIVSNENYDAMTHPGLAGVAIMDRVPDVLRQQNENKYSPTTISIGPLHRGTERLQQMEPVKLSYMCSLLKRTETFEETKKACAATMLKLEQKVRNCYEPARLQPNTENYSLSEVMLIDGCFIIELLYRNYQKNYDPILWNPFKYYAVQRDLLLLENQIPYFVLEQLFNLTVKRILGERNLQLLDDWVVLFFGDMMGLENVEIKIKSTRPYHILHFFHLYYLPPCTDDDAPFFIYEEPTEINFSATELRLAGVELKAGKKRGLFDIKFSSAFSCSSCWFLFKKGQLEIPPFSVSESTESFLTNLIAFELSCLSIDSYFTSLAFLMYILIDIPEDVKLLEEAGIIRNYLGSREEVARLFNAICKNAIPRRFHYSKQYRQAKNFCKPWRVSTGRLRHYYFGNPWSGISVIAAIILFALAFMQTLYTTLSFYHH